MSMCIPMEKCMPEWGFTSEHNHAISIRSPGHHWAPLQLYIPLKTFS